MIKSEYRAWYKPDKKYITDDYIHQMYINMKGEAVWCSHEGYENADKKIVVEHWTGLKDNKKVKIYRNDIVRANSRENPYVWAYYRIHFDAEYGSWVGIHLKGINTVGDITCWPLGELRFNIEVVGTMHQNPELIPENYKWA